uniref:Centromere protein P n=1 Tax=Monopterus albus TaxID=43700 RepID=A0A3Q3KEZ4_MONAL
MSQENPEEVKVLEAQIECLQAESLSFIHLHRLYMCGQRQEEGEKVLSKLMEEVEKLEEDLERQTQMNRISLKSCTTKTLQSSGSKLVQQLSVSGHCSEMAFQVEFKLSENKVIHFIRRITDLNVVMDASDLQTFSSFLSEVEESRDLLLFFRTLRTFSDRSDDRCRTFQHFQAKYPSVVSLPGGCRSEFLWFSIISAALQLFPSQAVGGAAESFQSLLRILGPEAALESVIRAVSLSQDTQLASHLLV